MRSHIMIETKQVGNLGTNCYLLCNKDTMETVIIDPGADGNTIRDTMQMYGMTPAGILLTHGHYDHIGALESLKSSYYQIKVYAGSKERKILNNTDANLSSFLGKPYTVEADVYVEDGDQIELAGAHFRCIHTPGHTPGGMCYYAIEDDVLFSGDTLFAGSVGRTDFPGGDGSALIQSLKEKIRVLPDHIKVYPGHGPSSMLEIEFAENPYF